MKIIDKYVLREFIIGFLWSLIAIVSIYIIVDVFEHISTFVDKRVSILVIIQYYIYEIPWIIGTLICPIACLLGCFISIGNLSRHFELVATKSAGISLYRVLLPLLCFGFILSGVIFGVNEIISPKVNEKRLNLKREKIDKRPKITESISKNVYYSGEGNRFYHIGFINPNTGVIKEFTIYEFLQDYALKKKFVVNRAVWKDNQWLLFNVKKWTFKPDSYKVIDSLITNLKETPLDFAKGIKSDLSMGFWEFKTYVKKLQRSGEDVTDKLVDLYSRISFPFMNLIIILLGVPLAAKVRSIGFIMGFAIALFASFVYWGLMQLAKGFGHAGTLPPLGASVLPNILFIIAALILLWKVRK